jgi:hydrophobe/amphiphile efflux-3 (HAE3) family protein
MRSAFARIGAWCVERPAPVIALAVLLALVGVIGASSLKPNGEAETLVDKGSDTFRATEDFKEKFGDDAVVVLVRGDLQELVLGPDLQRLLLLEGCLAGNAPPDNLTERVATPEVCNQLAESKPARVVYGPATFLNQFALQAKTLYEEQARAAVVQSREAAVDAYRRALRQGLDRTEAQRAAEAAEQSVIQAFTAQTQELATRYGQTGLPSLTNPTFISSVVFDSRFADGTPKSRFSYLFPSNRNALVSIRLRPDLSESERAEAIDLIRAAVGEDAFRLRSGSYLVSGVPVVVDGLTDELKSEIFILLIAALVVMALVLALVFTPPLRLLPLLIGLVASAIAFGALALFGGTLTMASIAGLPVLIGLAVDYAIQLQARFGEARAGGSSPARAAAEAAARGGPVIGTACLATAAGFLVLLLSPIPMVRSFGILLVAGIVIAFVLALTVGLTILSLTGEPGEVSDRAARLRGRLPGPPAAVSRLSSSARARLARLGPRSLAISIANPGRVIVAATVLAVAGWVAGTRTEIISDFRELVPRDLPALENVDVLQDETGVSGQVDVTVTADDLSDPEVVGWMRDFRQRVLQAGGFEGDFTSCLDEGTRLCPAISLPDLFGGDAAPTQERIRGVLELLPAYFSQAVVETDPETGAIGNTAVLSFGIKVMPFDEQKELIDAVRNEIDPPGSGRPPTGVDVEVVGLPVLVADANSKLSSNRYLMTIAGLLAIALVLIAVYRSLKRALVPLIPVVLAPGWSALVLESAGVPLNPMSATLGALVIAIATEFSVLLSARYHEEREAGASVGESLRLSYSRTGSAVLASGVTAIAGFAVLALAAPIQLLFGGDAIRMLTEFGLVAVVDLLVALAGVLLVLPAVLVGAESDFAAVRSRFARLTRSEARAEV